MNIKKILTGSVLLLLLTACGGVSVNNDGSGVKRASINTNFYQRWVNAYEEQSGSPTLNIFRPANSQDFSQGGFRMAFAFDTNGECSYKDKHSGNMWNCVFTKIGKKVYLYDQQGKLLSHLIFTLVEEPSQDKMRLTYGIASPVKKEKPKK